MNSIGKYEIIELVGSGATADVYRAREPISGREVALKVLKPALVADRTSFDRFVQEAKAAEKLIHINIATVLDMGESEGRFFIVMRYIEGMSLDKRIKEAGSLSWEETLAMVQQVGAALEFAHKQGFLHRDVKPNNIICSSDGQYVLTDFGLARAMQSTGLTSHTGAALGTPPYIAPEIWQGEEASPASDQYSLACVVYEAITGKILFGGNTPAAIMTNHLMKEPQFPAQWPEGVPQGVGAVLARAVMVDPGKRYPVLIDFVKQLGESHTMPFTGVPSTGRQTGKPGEPSPHTSAAPEKPKKKNRWVLTCGVLAVVALLCLSVVFVTMGNRILPVVSGWIGLPGKMDEQTQQVDGTISDDPMNTTTAASAENSTFGEPTSTQSIAAAPVLEITQTEETAQPNVPADVSHVSNVTGKLLGEAYEANGITITLKEYDIKSDGEIYIKFIIKNESNKLQLIRFQNRNFTLEDDTGKKYQQDEDFLVDDKQFELEPGEVYEIYGNSYPEYSYRIGLFYGMVPEQARFLIVKVDPFMDIANAQWIIPLDAGVAAAQSPGPHEQQGLLDGFEANGLEVLLVDYSIESNGELSFSFMVKNNGNNPALVRFQDKYFEVWDDVGNQYEQDQDFIVEAKQYLLQPGDSYEIYSNSYPEYAYRIGTFYGMVPEEANNIIIKITQLMDIRDAEWVISLDTLVSEVQSPEPGSQIAPLESFSANGLEVFLMEYSIESNGEIQVRISVKNNGNNPALVRFQDQYFELHDDQGNRYDQDQDFLVTPKQFMLEPGESYEIYGNSYPEYSYRFGLFYGVIPSNVDYLIFRISKLMDFQDMQWVIPLD